MVRRSACNQQVFHWRVRILLVAEIRHSCEKGITLLGVRSVVRDCLIKRLGMSSHVYVTGYNIPCHLSKRVGHPIQVVGFLLVSFSKYKSV